MALALTNLACQLGWYDRLKPIKFSRSRDYDKLKRSKYYKASRVKENKPVTQAQV